MNLEQVLSIIEQVKMFSNKETKTVYCHTSLWSSLYRDACLLANETGNGVVRHDWFQYAGVFFIPDDSTILELVDVPHYKKSELDFTDTGYYGCFSKGKPPALIPVSELFPGENNELESLMDEFDRLCQENSEKKAQKEACQCGLAAVGQPEASSRHMRKCPKYTEE